MCTTRGNCEHPCSASPPRLLRFRAPSERTRASKSVRRPWLPRGRRAHSSSSANRAAASKQSRQIERSSAPWTISCCSRRVSTHTPHSHALGRRALGAVVVVSVFTASAVLPGPRGQIGSPGEQERCGGEVADRRLPDGGST